VKEITMPYRIYPPIGIARLGNDSTAFYIGPERPGDPGVELNGQENETPISRYKSSPVKIKRQAARFRLFEQSADGSWVPAQLPPGATIEWTVELANKKGAVVRPGSPPNAPTRPQLQPNSDDKVIRPAARTIKGAGQSGQAFAFDNGTFLGRKVPLGELRTDKEQNLIVLGGFGFSSSPNNTPLTGSFYRNPNWHDDVSDGPITAQIRLADNSIVQDSVAPAWAVVAPPDFAPSIGGVVSLYDILLQVAFDHFNLQLPGEVSFTQEVYPLLSRTRRLQWVNLNALWAQVSDDYAALADSSSSQAATDLRSKNADRVRGVEGVLSDFQLTDRQRKVLNLWQAGTFKSDWVGPPTPPAQITAAGLTRAALEAAVGQGFFPGIEAGILVQDETIYSSPFDFRIDPQQLTAGDLTALMAQPWQADFTKCAGSWWPSQRPDNVRPNPNATNSVQWAASIHSHQDMINKFNELTFVTPQRDAQGNLVFAVELPPP
jgi:hypothetical protein